MASLKTLLREKSAPLSVQLFSVYTLSVSLARERNYFTTCTALVVGCDDVAPCYSAGVLTRRQVGSWEGSREARVVAGC